VPSEDLAADAVTIAYNSGSAHWPQFRLTFSEFAAYAERVQLSDNAVGHAADVFLAFACLARDPRALMQLEQLLQRNIPVFVSRIDSARAFADDARQRVCELLLNASPPKLTRYSGMGSLLGWLRVVAIRAALDIKRGNDDQPVIAESDLAEHMAHQPRDPEIDLIKNRFHDVFEEAMVAGVAQLTARQRAVLRLYLVSQMNIDRIGKIYGVHRSTVARWVSSAQKTVLTGARAHLRDRHRLDTADLHSLGRLVRSELHVSISRLLRS